jgi:hypothetical protein
MKHGKKTGIFTVLLAALIALGGCSSGFNHSSGGAANDSPDRVMRRATADKIFELIQRDDGLAIVGFKSTTSLAVWLLSDDARASVSVNVPDSFTIPANIGNMRVVEISDNALGTQNPGGDTDISTAAAAVELPPSIKRLGSDLFAGIEKASITLAAPADLVRTVGADSIVRAAGEKGIPKRKDGSVITRTDIAKFERPKSGVMTYTLSYYNDEGTAKLNGKWYKISDLVLKNLFGAVYKPNSPGSFDPDEKSIAYTERISADVLALFEITIGANAVYDKVELKGTMLPSVDSADAKNKKFIIIDIGLPDSADNSALPAFYIPKEPDNTLGNANVSGKDYSHIRLRVNKGAKLVILADNSNYAARGEGNPCPDGNFKGGCVEVMAGGQLRDGAFEGFPLGSGAVILNRAGSYLSVGPEPTDNDAKIPAYAQYYAGYLLGPAGSGARIEWNNGTNSDYLEVRSKQIATNAKLTVKKNLGLIYSVWFLSDAKLTIDITPPNDGLLANERAGGEDYNFYSQSATIGLITIRSGFLDRRLLTAGPADFDPQSHAVRQTTINGRKDGVSKEYAGAGIVGHLVAP